MNRRQHLLALAAAAAALRPAAAAASPIQLHVDLEVDPARESELASTFRDRFRPAIRKQPGFVEVKLLKLQAAVAGAAPARSKYRLLIAFASEEQRKKWVATPLHQEVWPAIERTLTGAKYTALLYEVAG